MKRMFLKILKTPALEFLTKKVVDLRSTSVTGRCYSLQAQVLRFKFCKNFNSTYFAEHMKNENYDFNYEKQKFPMLPRLHCTTLRKAERKYKSSIQLISFKASHKNLKI